MKRFIARRYGPVIAEKWQNIFNFDNPMDYDTFCQKVLE